MRCSSQATELLEGGLQTRSIIESCCYAAAADTGDADALNAQSPATYRLT